MQELFHDEQTQSVPTTAVSGQSQTRSAQYSRNYRKNPEKNRKINEDRRRNYKMKKEKPDNVSSMFESVARPGKLEPQTIEKVLNKSDKPSLSDLWGVSSWELNDSSQSYCQKDQMSVVTRMSENVSNEKSNNVDTQNQPELLLELRNSFKGIHNELRLLREEVKPTAPALPTDNKVEQQAISESVKNANDRFLSKVTAENQAEKPNFIAGFFQQISQMDGAAFARNFPAALVLGFCAYHACLFVAEQTIPLYESLKFPNPQMACYGAVGQLDGMQTGSKLWLLKRAPRDQDTLDKASSYTKEALSWLLEDGLAESLEVETSYEQDDLLIDIIISNNLIQVRYRG